MAKLAAPPCKPPADKGHHIVLNFPVANIKEQSIKVQLHGPDDNAEASSSVSVSFETFSPTKRYEKVLTLPEPVCLRHITKNLTSKNLSIIVVKAAHAPPPSPSSKVSSTPAAPPSPVLMPSVVEAPVLKQGSGCIVVEDANPLEQSDEEIQVNGNAEAAATGKKKKKNKPRKKAARNSKAEDEEDTEDKEVLAASEAVEASLGAVQAARSSIQGPKKELEAAQAREEKAAQKVRHFEAELRKWQAFYEAEIKKWQAERKAAGAQLEGSNERLAQAHAIVDSLEAQTVAKRGLLREAEAKARLRERLAAEKEETLRQESEKQAQVEKQREQEDRRKRAEEERQRTNEEKKRKEAERKENAKRREEERKKQEEEDERRKAEKKGKMASPGAAAGLANGKGKGIYLEPAQQQQAATLAKLFKLDVARARVKMEEYSKAPNGTAFLVCLAQILEDGKNFAASGEVWLNTLDRPDADTYFNQKEGTDLAMKVMAFWKDHPEKLHECLPLLEKLTPKYSIFSLGRMMSDRMPKQDRRPTVPQKPPPPVEEPWRGPLIEEIECDPVAATSSKPTPSRSTKPRSPEASIARSAAPDAQSEAAEGWVLHREGDEGPCWVLELPVPSIESLAEVNLDISGDAVLLTPIGGGTPVAQSKVPADADADQAGAKWSKKKRVLTIRMPQVT